MLSVLQVQEMIDINLKRFYLKTMLGKVKEVRWMRQGTQIAAVYR